MARRNRMQGQQANQPFDKEESFFGGLLKKRTRKPKANTRGATGNLAAAGAASAGRAARADKATKRFAKDTEDLGAANMRMNAAQKKAANKRVKSTDGKSDRPSAASMRDSAAQRAALAKSEPKKESKPTKKAKVTGRGGRNVGKGEDKKANVTREQLQKTGLTLRDYLNFMDKNNRRPTKADAAAAKSITEGFKKKKAVKKAGGGMMKSKMKAKGMKAGGKMKTKGYMAGGLKDAPEGNTGLKKLPKQVRNKMGFKAKGGMMKTKGYAKGGMKTKGYAKGGKVRGAGIARKGVRPAKMR